MIMRKFFKAFISIVIALNVIELCDAAPIRLESMPQLKSSQARLISGGRLFAQHCMQCHSLQYFTHDPIGDASGVVPDRMPKIDPEAWSGHPPPDLSLITRYRGTDWLYTYFYSYYQDASRPTGSNHLLTANTSMPNPFEQLQGTHQLMISKDQLSVLEKQPASQKPPWYRILKTMHAGSIPAAEFDTQLTELVLFLEYVGEPHRAAREALGGWVIMFLLIFFVVAFLLYREYWKMLD